ncbi:Cuticle protein 6 [Eumeta japonica]|uniref:Cuticle protein 6 n=1 Tax=Eumeta variegata TaxID=151549 RepID=A0A4C1XEQ8_EUMVA|nr:Cuticle protein 6 [Eumeta japonica]
MKTLPFCSETYNQRESFSTKNERIVLCRTLMLAEKKIVTTGAAAPAPTLAPSSSFLKLDISPEEAAQYLASPPFSSPALAPHIETRPLVRWDSPQFRAADAGPTRGHYWRDGHEIQNTDDYVEDVYRAAQFHGQDGLGAYKYGYSAPESAKVEDRARTGRVEGAYTYVGGAGGPPQVEVRYWADHDGFHQEDNLPKVKLQPAQETEEVRRARLEHERAWHQAADAALHPNAQ